ncbi:mannitol dehydrogenase family protein [Flagellimonas flava]|uniref:Mannitol 2-dehydrogenase n=1 Tax=Flagellimonas flava TaxID=570519 RepID=A0A1M5HXH6_9FLAO|nr:mannitol dehydrogenase family protein [Allomuricauda flava]SHG20587.1 mannitol 2-dehydrogenase [Allomuricauda flava]
MELNQKNLDNLSNRISCPEYDRKSLATGIVHIGVGGFHRSHQAYYIHLLLQKDDADNWAICGVGLREGDRNMYNVLKEQDGLYTLVTQHPNGDIENEIIGSIAEFLLAVDDPQAVIDKLASETTKIVSLTITEGGYNFNPSTGEFDFENPDIQHELRNPNEPKTVYGYLTAALKKRRANGFPPFTIMSCDNIQHNGAAARKMVLAFAKKQDPQLASWIEKEVSFPNSMVDRITPVTTKEIIDYLKNEYDLQDKWPVVCEPFIQWVVEDNFSNGRPQLENLGVQFVPDVTPYEKMKIRLLNAGHSVLGITGAIHGHPTIDSCMRDETFRKFMRGFMDKEVTPILGSIEGIDMEDYKDNLEIRFGNPNIKDSVSRICSESSAKLPKFLIPTLIENLEQDGSIKFATFILAAWCYYSDKRINKDGRPTEIIDAMAVQLHEAARKTATEPLAFLEQESLFGNLSKNKRFTELYKEMIGKIYGDPNIKKYMQDVLGE